MFMVNLMNTSLNTKTNKKNSKNLFYSKKSYTFVEINIKK